MYISGCVSSCSIWLIELVGEGCEVLCVVDLFSGDIVSSVIIVK